MPDISRDVNAEAAGGLTKQEVVSAINMPLLEKEMKDSAPPWDTSPARPVVKDEKGEPNFSTTFTISAIGSPQSVTAATAEKSLDIIRKQRHRLIKMIESDPENVLDESLARSLITDDDYDNLNALSLPETKSRKLLIQIQKKGESVCQQFLECLESILPEGYQDLQHLVGEGFNQESRTVRAPELGEKDDVDPEVEVGIRGPGELQKTDLSKEGFNQESQTVRASELWEKDDVDPEVEVVFQEPGELEKTDLSKEGFNLESRIVRAPELWEKDDVNPEMEADMQEPRELEKRDLSKERSEAAQDVLSRLNLEQHRSRKIRLRDVLEICPESIKPRVPEALGDLPWHFLRKLMALNGTARNTSLGHETPAEEMADDSKLHIDDHFCFSDAYTKVSLHPLDVLCAVLLCSDSFLQQEILSKMSMCQFALPVLLPDLDSPRCTLLLWAMRDIVRRWRPHSLAQSRGFKEESLVLTQMPTVSFVRLGSCSFSKSQLLNEVLSPAQQHHNFFVHRDMESGDVQRKIADGLVEIAWYFPAGKESSDLFPEPIAVTNLCGDIESHWLQFSFLTEVSSAVFIITESISEREYALLSSLKESTAKYYFILNCKSEIPKETLEFLNQLAPVLKLSKSQLLVKNNSINNAGFVKKIQSTMRNIVNSSPRRVSLEAMAVMARELGMQVDEDSQACQCPRKHAEEITAEIRDVAKYKRENLRLQGDPWRNLGKVEKELCRMQRQGDKATEDYKSELKRKWLEIRRQQHECDLTGGLIKFINGVGQLSPVEKHYFLKWMKFSLDNTARESLSKMRAEYKKKCETPGADRTQLEALDKLISESSLGVEHFMRELGQFYEAEHAIAKEDKMAERQRQFTHLPGIAAELMLEGFPMELIDGDASNIPLQWVTDVLTQLHAKLGGRSKMLVVTVLGVQSTGKSTLLNTMFGLQFAVSSGRCTRGAFMTLIKVTDAVQELSGCDFILVIDTEGLKAPELTALEDSYQHDNELATVVVGLSDITLVNMAMENATEMKDVLQIAVHAFLRMEKIGQKPNCQFVHQNVSDVSAHEQNMRDRKHLLEQLDEMTRAAARMEKQSRAITFSDIMQYDPEKHNWYIPGLWHGVPPMAPVNTGYSESVCELKKYLFEFIENLSQNRTPKNIPDFIEWLRSLWNSVKHENFIFSFRNSLVAEAYNLLAMKYSEWEWGFRKQMYLWISEKETFIQNQLPDKLEGNLLGTLKIEAQKKLQQEEQQLLDNLDQYFKGEAANLNLIEKYREDFKRSASSLKRELEGVSISKCEEAIRIRRGQHKIGTILSTYKQTIEGKVDRLLAKCRNRKQKLDDEKLKTEFEKMWKETLSELKLSRLQRRQVVQDLDFQLRKDLENRGSAVKQMLQEVENLLSYRMESFRIRKDQKWYSKIFAYFTKDCYNETEELAVSLMKKCKKYIEEKVKSKTDYHETYCGELLRMVNERLRQEDVQKLLTTPHFEVYLKLHILGEAAHAFQKMHEDFIQENDPQQCLEKLKPQYFKTFKALYLEKDGSQTLARDFCDQCLKPALVEHVNKILGLQIVDDILSSEQSITYSSRGFFQFKLLKELLEKENFDSYVDYIRTYEEFVKTWIRTQLLKHYSKTAALGDMEKKILSSMIDKVRKALKNSSSATKNTTISDFLDSVCNVLQKDLVISRDNLVGIRFLNTNSSKQFSDFIPNFLPDLEEQILAELKSTDIESKLSHLSVKPEVEMFKRVFGCGKQCPFCKVPCEAGAPSHKEHFASVHRPQGLGQYRSLHTKKLDYDICSSDVVGNCAFRNSDTEGKFHPYKEYRDYYPDWNIQPDPSIEASSYWKFVFHKFNHQFAEDYEAKPADLPKDWGTITKKQALESIKQVFNMK